MPTTYVSQPRINFLEMAHTNFFSSIRKTQYELQMPTMVFLDFQTIRYVPAFSKNILLNMFIYTVNYTDAKSHNNILNMKLK